MTIDIVVNGDESRVENGSTLADLLESVNIDVENTRGIAVAVNDEIIRRTDWNKRELNAGDSVELVTARQGG
ncbi:MAG: sulfur carrier protein ThiS [Bacteroidetes bacterium]|nr:sulfur carrier protein ThiS [Bacteroidota bacterium]MCZ6705847.1 sulfur carrier protein ThiS [Bacteroidota bacterium]MCZ6757889.1 sulfur carrier protein ThiS [Bacteroidota bacterium]